MNSYCLFLFVLLCYSATSKQDHFPIIYNSYQFTFYATTHITALRLADDLQIHTKKDSSNCQEEVTHVPFYQLLTLGALNDFNTLMTTQAHKSGGTHGH